MENSGQQIAEERIDAYDEELSKTLRAMAFNEEQIVSIKARIATAALCAAGIDPDNRES